jgi:hypothetical protein
MKKLIKVKSSCVNNKFNYEKVKKMKRKKPFDKHIL